MTGRHETRDKETGRYEIGRLNYFVSRVSSGAPWARVSCLVSRVSRPEGTRVSRVQYLRDAPNLCATGVAR